MGQAPGQPIKAVQPVGIQPDWVCNLGEQATHIVYHYNQVSRRHDIVVVGEQTLFVLNEGADGKIRYQRRLEFAPSELTTSLHTRTSTSQRNEQPLKCAHVPPQGLMTPLVSATCSGLTRSTC